MVRGRPIRRPRRSRWVNKPGGRASAGNLGEIRDLSGRRTNARKQRQTVGTNRMILIIHENAFKE